MASIDLGSMKHGQELLKRGFATMQEGGVIMDVVNAEEAAVAEESGAVAVMALERVPADIRSAGGVARMSHPDMIKGILETTTIPVMAKARIGHEDEARVLQSLGVDMIDESEVLTPADPFYHINKKAFDIPFVCGCTNLGEAVRRISEGAAMIRTKGEAGTGNVVSAVQHSRILTAEIEHLRESDNLESIIDVIMEGYHRIKSASSLGFVPKMTPFGSMDDLRREVESVTKDVKELGRLPVVTFSAGGISTPADAALMMRQGMDGVFVGSGIFKSSDPQRTAEAIVLATHSYNDPEAVAEASAMIGEPMPGLEIETLAVRMEDRGW